MPKAPQRQSRNLLILMVALMAIAGVGVVTIWKLVAAGPRDPGYGAAPVQVGGPFSLVDQTGAPVTDQSYKGKYRLIYFGYTFCPDACPTELQIMAQAIDSLGADGAKIQPIFITIDPERDTVEHMAAYVKLFDPRLVGLTGTPEQIAGVARAYRVYYAKAPAQDEGPYMMNHSSYVYLMNPDGKFLTVFSSDLDADRLASEIRRYMGAS
jgi:protein SCO1/2